MNLRECTDVEVPGWVGVGGNLPLCSLPRGPSTGLCLNPEWSSELDRSHWHLNHDETSHVQCCPLLRPRAQTWPVRISGLQWWLLRICQPASQANQPIPALSLPIFPLQLNARLCALGGDGLVRITVFPCDTVSLHWMFSGLSFGSTKVNDAFLNEKLD